MASSRRRGAGAIAAMVIVAVAALEMIGPASAALASTHASPTTTTRPVATPKRRPKVIKIASPKRPVTFQSTFSARVKPDGTVPLGLALDAFASVFGPLPGTKTDPLPTKGLRDVTLVTRAVLAHWSDLSAAQRAAVAKFLVGPNGSFVASSQLVARGAGDAVAATTPGDRGRSARMPSIRRTATTVAQYAALADLARSRIEARLGLTFGLALRVATGPSIPSGDADALSLSGTAPADLGVAPDGCLVTFTPAVSTYSADVQMSVVTHEVFHCFQYQIQGASPVALPDWVIEGQAEWAAETIMGGTTDSARFWNSWLTAPTSGLYARSYDAIGFYSVLAANGRDPWSVMPSMLHAADSQGAFLAAVGSEGDLFLNRVATAETRLPAFGAAWESTGPGITAANGRFPVTVNAGSPVTLHGELSARGNQGMALTVHGDVLVVDSDAPLGAIAFAGLPATTFVTGVTGSWCVRAGGCTCPDGGVPSANGRPVAPGAPGTVALTVTTNVFRPHGLRVDLAAESVADACRTPAEAPSTSAACLIGNFHLVDQHLIAPIASALGSLTITGGIGGRRIEIRADGTYHVTDDGSDPVTVSGDASGVAVASTANVVADATGRYAVHGSSVDFVNETESGTVTISANVGGQTIEQSQPLDAAGLGSVYGFNGTAGFECRAAQLSLSFPNVTFVLARA